MFRRATVFIFLLLAFAQITIGIAEAQTWTWTTETVAPQGTFTSIAADQAGNLHLTYSGVNHQLRYAFRPAGGSKWFDMPLAQGGNFSQVRLDKQGFPHVCYTFQRDIYYAAFDGKKWNTQQIAPGSGTGSYSCSVAVAADGTPHVTWYHEQLPDLHNYLHFKHAVLTDGSWYVRTVDMCKQTGKWHFMVLDANGNPHVSYDCFVAGQQRYASYDGNKWNITIVDDRERAKLYDVGLGSSLYLTPNGQAMIAYYAFTGSTNNQQGLQPSMLRFARQRGDKWDIQTIDHTQSAGGWTAFKSYIVVDQQGNPHISYEDAGNLKHAYWDGKEWHTQLLAGGGMGDLFRYNAMTIDGDNRIYISYRASNGAIMVATGQWTGKPTATARESAK